MDKVMIMMAVFNGEQFIERQLESIRRQTYKNWYLVIQDDGSKDRTKEIIQEYSKKDHRIQIKINKTGYHGAFENFHVLINEMKNEDSFDYYMFCDQDDVWHENKIERMIAAMKRNEKESGGSAMPLLCYADMSTVDKEGKVVLKSLNHTWGLEKRDRASFFLSHKVFGCNSLMNYALFRLVPPLNLNEPYIHHMSHDNHYTKYAAVFGKVVYLDENLMDYRRHGENTTGEQRYTVSAGRLVYRITHIADLSKRHANVYNQSLVTLNKMKTAEMTKEQTVFVKEIERIIRKGGITALQYIHRHHVTWGQPIENISRKIVLTLGIYKRYLIEP